MKRCRYDSTGPASTSFMLRARPDVTMTFSESIKNYWEMIKPKIVLLLVFTGMAGMLVAYRETDKVPDALQLAVGFVAIFLGSAGVEVLTQLPRPRTSMR